MLSQISVDKSSLKSPTVPKSTGSLRQEHKRLVFFLNVSNLVFFSNFAHKLGEIIIFLLTNKHSKDKAFDKIFELFSCS